MRAVAGLLPILLLADCSKAMPPPPPIESKATLSRGSPAAELSLGRPSDLAIIEVTDVQNPFGAPVTIAVEDNGSAPSTDRFSLYPPDRPGRFSVRLSKGATLVRVSLLPSPTGDGPDVVVQLSVEAETAR